MQRSPWIPWFVCFTAFILYGTYQFYQGGNEEGYGRSLCGPPMGYNVQISQDFPTIKSYAKRYKVNELYIRACNLAYSDNLENGAHIVIPKGWSLYVWIVWILIIITPFIAFIFKYRRR